MVPDPCQCAPRSPSSCPDRWHSCSHVRRSSDRHPQVSASCRHYLWPSSSPGCEKQAAMPPPTEPFTVELNATEKALFQHFTRPTGTPDAPYALNPPLMS